MSERKTAFEVLGGHKVGPTIAADHDEIMALRSARDELEDECEALAERLTGKDERIAGLEWELEVVREALRAALRMRDGEA